MHKPLLSIRQLRAWYGPSQALHGIDLDVREGELVALLGRNGAGKTTLLKAIMGMGGRVEGSIRLRDKEIAGAPPHEVARGGIGYVPDDRGIYASLTVRENLLLPPLINKDGMSEEELFALFPNLAERANSSGTKLSGGEQQMLAIARILRTGARLLLLDEPTEGLAPVIVQRIGELLQQLKARGYTILLVEQNVEFASDLADRHYLIETGRVADEYDALTLGRDFDRVAARLGV
jgi:branched-chain amino acid transport system ATP-binding protein